MSASSVILRGFKGGTLVTRGYSVGDEVPPPTPVIDTPTGGWIDPPGWRKRKPEHEPEVKRKIITLKIAPPPEQEKKPQTVQRSIVEGLFAPSVIELNPLPYEDEAARMARIMAIERRREEEILILLLALA